MQNPAIVSTFYKFTPLSNYKEVQPKLLEICYKNQLLGTILLAKEGINATISGTRDGLDNFYSLLISEFGIKLTNIKESLNTNMPFEKMKVRLKKEIVRIGMEEIDGNDAGHYVAPEDWDEFILRDDVILIDTRNKYEIGCGSFQKAIDPQTRFFREFPKWFDDNIEQFKNKKVAMFCTGGVRCEKSTAFAKTRGITDVYHLDGGILNYFEKVGSNSRTWHGECFVFDDRIAVDIELKRCDKYDGRIPKLGDER